VNKNCLVSDTGTVLRNSWSAVMMMIIIIMFVVGNDDAQVRAVKWIRRLVVCISQQSQVWHQSGPGGICGGQSGSISSGRPTLIFPRHYHAINARHSLIWDRRNTIPVTSSVVKQNVKSRTQSYTWASFSTTPVNGCKDMSTVQQKISLSSKNRWAGNFTLRLLYSQGNSLRHLLDGTQTPCPYG